MAICWIMTLPRETSPYLVFELEADAKAARDLVEKVSGERPWVVEAELMQRRNEK